MSAEELSQFYESGEATAFNEWLDSNWVIIEESMTEPWCKTISWHGKTGFYQFTIKQFSEFVAIRNSPLYKALL